MSTTLSNQYYNHYRAMMDEGKVAPHRVEQRLLGHMDYIKKAPGMQADTRKHVLADLEDVRHRLFGHRQTK